MAIQSPKSKRSEEPGKRSIDDGLSETSKDHVVPQHHNPPGSGKPTIPSMDRTERAGGKGVIASEGSVAVGATTPHQGGSKAVLVDTSKGDQSRKGGSVHQT